MKEKEGANIIGGALRRETWIHPGDGRRVRRTTSAANEARLSHASDLEELSQLTSVEVSISVSTYLPNSYQKIHSIYLRCIKYYACTSRCKILLKLLTYDFLNFFNIKLMNINDNYTL